MTFHKIEFPLKSVGEWIPTFKILIDSSFSTIDDTCDALDESYVFLFYSTIDGIPDEYGDILNNPKPKYFRLVQPFYIGNFKRDDWAEVITQIVHTALFAKSVLMDEILPLRDVRKLVNTQLTPQNE